MSTKQDALEHLRVIRSLMEKAHIYRAISAPAALLGGLLAVVCAGYTGWQMQQKGGLPETMGVLFLWQWLGILVVSSSVNVILLAREAARRGQPLVSEGMRMALRAIFPPLLVGGVLGCGLIVYLQNHILATLLWVVCYGLALLATASFSPRSLVRLGWVFVALGLALFWAYAANSDIRNMPHDDAPANLIMGLTFGLCHIGYAAAVFCSQKPEAVTQRE
ncbi:hypothetical protein [Prosthecobacter dejongeii]|uniref:Lysylphosphatidylglycerol synthetase-like protein (DUF2156 family) n=1 Tax=Prosthecobacter dejongeii TaxID=48465 RepID=A0A7W7YNE6_9BACT|nr:hypothetical protein [Prosthecobacter dejongeii]MBB5039262.1 lysylphosphatidylglycerol synthetase-like protein (DUF2156 family) [Prosthecobacter dejongeii]